VQDLLGLAEVVGEALVEDGDELEAEERLDAGQHRATFVEERLRGLLEVELLVLRNLVTRHRDS